MTGIKLDFDKAVRETVTLAGQSPLGVFFLMNYVSGFPLTDTIEFVSRDPRQFQIKSDYTIDMGDAESTFWGAFRACFGPRPVYPDLQKRSRVASGEHGSVQRDQRREIPHRTGRSESRTA